MLCRECKVRDYEPSLWLTHIWYLFRLQKGGYPFHANDLTIEEWIDLGIFNEEYEANKKRLENGK